jgi:hypothetical protein
MTICGVVTAERRFYVAVKDCRVRVISVCRQGVAGPSTVIGGGGDKYYLHMQSSPALIWTVIHNLGKFPSITAMVGGRNISARVDHLDTNSAEIRWGAPTAGSASCD